MLIRKLFKAEMAHLVPGAYTTRCHHLHGHSYKYELFLRSNEPNEAQMVVDFKGIKDIGVNDFFDSFDHAVMIWEKDPIVSLAAKINPKRHVIVPFIPTAEMMAKAFFVVCEAIVKTQPLAQGEKNVLVEKVIVHETETGYGCFAREDLPTDKFPNISFDRWIFSDGIRRDWKNKNWYADVKRRLTTVSDEKNEKKFSRRTS